MRTFSWQSTLPFPAGEVFAWHARPGAFERLSPPWRDVQVLRSSGSIAQGAEVMLRLGLLGPFGIQWLLRHGEYAQGELFTDEQVRGPFGAWRHSHSFTAAPSGHCLMTDEIQYRLPLLARPLSGIFERDLARLFAFRHRVLAADLALHGRWSLAPRKTILISGASGFIGSALSAFLSTAGHTVLHLVRRKPRAPHERSWSPGEGSLLPEALHGADVVVHLGGESIMANRWSPSVRERLVQSRVGSTQLLASTIAALPQKPELLIVASGVGFYGDTGSEAPDEEAPKGAGFLADLAAQWEAAAAPAADSGVRVASLRIGTVLNARGGALKKMLPPFRLGLGGPLGPGTQRMGWIALQDLLGLIEHVIHTPSLGGAVNAVAPQVITNCEFVQALARRVGRCAFIPAPAPMLRALFGEVADAALLSSSAATPKRALESGYRFVLPAVSPALEFEVP